MEHPELHCVCVDLDAGTGVADLDALAAEIRGPGAESQVALRGGERRVARLARLRLGHDEIPLETPWRLVPASPGSLDQFRRDPSNAACQDQAKSRSRCRQRASISKTCSAYLDCTQAIPARWAVNARAVSPRSAMV